MKRRNAGLRFLLLGAAVSLVVGCKVAVIVVEGGEVQSAGLDTCAEGTICIVEVNDTNFSESFTAVPNAGWQFVRWNKGGNFLCADSTKPTCVISTVGTDGNEGIEAIIASDQTFYIMPLFGPEPDTVTVDGREWVQVDHFANLSWSDINAVCPAGLCSGILNGYNMTGWTWASVDDVNELFNHYIGSDALGPGPDAALIECSVVLEFINDGWRRSYPEVGVYLVGMIRTDDGPASTLYGALLDTQRCSASTNFFDRDFANWLSGRGAFFWRVP